MSSTDRSTPPNEVPSSVGKTAEARRVGEDRWFLLREVSPTLAIAAFYVCGFVVANVHLGLYQPLEMELLSGRYVAAAILYLLFVALGLGAGFFTLHLAGLRKSTIGFVLALLGGLVVSAVIAVLIYSLIAVPNAEREMYRLAVSFVAILAGLVIINSLAGSFFEPSEPASDREGRMRYVVTVVRTGAGLLLLWIGTMVMFGQVLYPAISSTFGGGGNWLVTVDIGDAAPMSRIASDTLVLIQESGHFYTFLGCDPVDKSKVQFRLANDDVKLMRFHRQVNLPSYEVDTLGKACRPAPRDSLIDAGV